MKISVVTVCYNSAATIEDTLQSVVMQTYPQVEHIVIDGGSTDSTMDIIDKYRHVLAHVHSGPDAGVYDAMNKGIAAATGDTIGFLNADDVFMHADVLLHIAEAFIVHQTDAVYGDLVYVDSQDLNQVRRYWRSNPFQAGDFAKGWCPSHPTFYVKKTIYDKLGGFDLNYRMGNDVELMMRFLEKHQISTHHIPELLVKMRMGGTSNQSLSNIWLQNKEILKAAKQLGLSFSWFTFWQNKIRSRLAQYRAKPETML